LVTRAITRHAASYLERRGVRRSGAKSVLTNKVRWKVVRNRREGTALVERVAELLTGLMQMLL
jgi:hypothetical protein